MIRTRSDDVVPTLGNHDGSRRNNFTVLRILFAWLVLYGHSFPLTGKGVVDPLKMFFGGSTWIGQIAVSGFFAISGFLVAASFIRRGFLDYTVSRMLRIYPALIVCVLLTVFLLGPLFTTLDYAAYFDKPQAWDYLWNATLLFPVDFSLPNVFWDHPRKGINGSLWTLPVEVSCYVLLAIAGAAGLLRSRALANVALVATFFFASQYFGDVPLIGRLNKWAEPSLYFLLGVGFYVNRDQVPLTGPLALLAAFIAYTAFKEPWFDQVFPVAFTYLTFYVAYCTPFLDLDRRFGDPSYGIYIYAWPVQQMVVHWFPEEGPYFNATLATLIVAALAISSWFLIEKPALALKTRVLSRRERS